MTHLSRVQTQTPIVSLRLWRSLSRVPRYHPLADRLHFERHYARVGTLWGGVATVLVLLVMTLGVAILPLIYFFANMTLNGAAWAGNIAYTIARQRTNNTYDLLCLLPDGALRLNWLICAEVLHHKNLLRRAQEDTMILVQVVGALPVIGLASLILLNGDTDARLTALTSLVFVLSIIATLVIDYPQSVVAACLVGAMAGNRVKTPRDARVWAMLVTVTLQMAFYALLAVMVAVMVWYYEQSETPVLWTGVLAPVAIVLVYGMLREMINRVLLRALSRMLNGDTTEFAHHSFLMH